MAARRGAIAQSMSKLDVAINATSNTIQYRVVSSEFLDAWNEQPRLEMNDNELEKLVRTVLARGVIQPLIVTPNADNTRFQVIAGNRRLEAVRRAEKIKNDTKGENEPHEHLMVPVVVRRDLINDPQKQLELAYMENESRESLSPIERLNAVVQLLKGRFGLKDSNLEMRLNEYRRMDRKELKPTKEYTLALAYLQELGFNDFNSFLANSWRLPRLPAEVLSMVNTRRLSQRVALVFVPYAQTHPELVLKVAQEAAEKELPAERVRAILKERAGNKTPNGSYPKIITAGKTIISNAQILRKRLNSPDLRLKKGVNESDALEKLRRANEALEEAQALFD